MKRYLVCGLFLLMFGAAVSPAAPQKATSPAAQFVTHWSAKNALVIPFEYNLAKNTPPAVWLRINGGKPHLFVVDTGCTLPLTLASSAAAEMKLDTVPVDINLNGAKFSVVKAPQITLYFLATRARAAKDIPFPVVPVRITAGPGAPAADNLSLENPIFVTAGINEIAAATSEAYSEPIAGIIGSGFLHYAYRAAQFDFVRRELTLYPKVDSRLRLSGAATLPLREKNDCYSFSVPLDSGKMQEMLIDTGNAGAIALPTSLAEDFNTLDSGNSSEISLRFGGRAATLDCLIPELRLGRLVEKDVLAVTEADKELISLGDARPAVGINFLSRFRVTLDYAHNEITLERASDYKKHLRLPAGTLGYGYRYDGVGTITDIEISADTPEAKAGLRNGDQLLAVNGVAITENTARAYSALFPPYEGDRVALLVQHKNGAKQTVHLTMPGLYDDLKSDPIKTIGLNLTFAGYEQTTGDIDADSLAGKAGFQQGDVILAVDGVSTQSNGKGAIMAQGIVRPGQSITYTIKRKGEDKPHDIVITYPMRKK